MSKKRSRALRVDTSPDNKMMGPGITKGDRPPFFRLGEYTFQDLCADLFAQEPSIQAARIFGVRGQRQYGIDIIAERHSNSGLEVGQCKRYQKFETADIVEASEEFLTHWEGYWQPRKVVRFILFIACDVITTQANEEIERQRERFRQLRIEYEVWDARKIEHKLQPHRTVVGKYCHPPAYWIEEICGAVQSNPFAAGESNTSGSVITDLSLIHELAHLASQEAERTLQQLRSDWQAGKESQVTEALEHLQNKSSIWGNISPQLKARVLAFRASTALETTGDVQYVEQLLDEAHTYAETTSEKRVRALLLHRSSKTDDALNLLDLLSDTDTHNMRAALLLEVGRREDAHNLIEQTIAENNANAETFRLASLFHLTNSELEIAAASIQKALTLEPNWVRLKFVAGMIHYFQALSPIAVPRVIVDYPLPIDWMLVKYDETSSSHLREAEQLFASLAEVPSKFGQNNVVDTWRLACLMNDHDRQEEALLLCRQMIDTDPTSFPALSWATVRRLDINFDRSRKALEKGRSANTLSLDEILVLAGIYSLKEEFDVALHLLEDTRNHFLEQTADPIWAVWYTQTLIRLDRFNEALHLVQTLPDSEAYDPVRAVVIGHQAIQTQDWKLFVQHHLDSFERTHSPFALLDACMALYQQETWDLFAQYAEQLVDTVGTDEVYRIAITGLYNAQKFERCLILIDRCIEQFRTPRLRQELGQIRVACLRLLGKFAEALEEAQVIVDNNPSISNRMNLITLCYETGDYQAVSFHAQNMVESDLHPRTSLILAQLVSSENIPLAQQFWRKAVSDELPDELLGIAFGLVFKLGLEAESEGIHRRLFSAQAYQQHGIQAIHTKEELLTIFDKVGRRNTEIQQSYVSGVLPTHFFAQELNISLVELYHSQLVQQEVVPAPLSSSPLYIRHGGRPLLEGFPENVPNIRLSMDITAILLAAHLNILEQVEKAFAPLIIPADVLPSLTDMVDRVQVHQLSVIEENEQLVDLVHRGLLKVATRDVLATSEDEEVDESISRLDDDWKALFKAAKVRRGFLLTFVPPTTLGETELSEEVSISSEILKHLLNCRTLAQTLRDRGIITRQRHQRALRSLATLANDYPGMSVPSRDAVIFCDDAIVNSLAGSGILEPACTSFKAVYISQNRLDEAYAVLALERQRKETIAWLKSLQERLLRGIKGGRYIALSALIDDEEKAPIIRSFYSLIKQTDHQEGDLVWIDDRYSTHFSAVGTAPIVGINDILKLLVARKVMSPVQYYDSLTRLRAANVRYIPVHSDEVLFYLKEALREHEDTLEIEETHALTTLRRYVAACIVRRQDLQLPPVPEQITNPSGEVDFILSLNRMIQHTLLEVWQTITDPQARRLFAEWILTHLALEYPSLLLHEREERKPDEPDFYRGATYLMGFLSTAYFFFGSGNTKDETYPDYIEWYLSRVFDRRVRSDPALADFCAAITKQTLLQTKASEREHFPEEVIDDLLQQYVLKLPEEIRTLVEADVEFLTGIGVEPTQVIVVNGVHFERDDFWNAVNNTINGRRAAIRATNLNVLVRFSLREEHGLAIICFDHPLKDETIGLNQPEFSILFEDASQQEAFLRRYRNTFDCDTLTFENLIVELLAIANPVERVLKLLTIWQESAQVFYNNLERTLKPKAPLHFPGLVEINSEVLSHYLRLPVSPESAVSVSLDESAKLLVQDLGVDAALRRLIGVPSPLPLSLLQALTALPHTERQGLLNRLAQAPGSIISRFHVLRLLIEFRSDDPTHVTLIGEISQHLVNKETKVEYEAFIEVLQWVNEQFSLRSEFRSLLPLSKTALVWSHTHQLVQLMNRERIIPAWIRDTFAHENQRISVEILAKDHRYWYDIAHPHHVEYERMVISGLAYAFDGIEDLVSDQVSNRLVDIAFPTQVGDVRFPSPILFMNTSFLQDASASFLSRNSHDDIVTLFNEDEALQLSNEALYSALEDTLERMMTQEVDTQVRVFVWSLLLWMVRDTLLPEQLKQRLVSLLTDLSLITLIKTDPQLWHVVFQIYMMQLQHLESEELKSAASKSVLEIASYCAALEQDSIPQMPLNFEGISQMLLEAAIRLSISSETSEVSLQIFGRLVVDLARRWKRMLTLSKMSLQYMCEDLPLAYAQQLWPTLVILRAL